LAANLHTALPGRIESYEYDKQRANVQPLIKRQYRDGVVLSTPVIVNVPVIFPRSGGASLTFPVEQGDTVLLIFSERALENWLSLGGETVPGDSRKFDLSDAMAIPGLFPFSDSSLAENNTDVLLKFGNGRVQITGNDARLEYGEGKIRAADGTVALGTSTNELIQILVDLCDVLLLVALIQGPGATYPLTTAATGTVTTIKTKLNSIKGSL
jgi:hypothetical protein